MLDLIQKPSDMSLGQHLTAVASSATSILRNQRLLFVCLPYEMHFSLDAIVRTACECYACIGALLGMGVRQASGIPISRTGLAAYCRAPCGSAQLLRPQSLSFWRFPGQPNWSCKSHTLSMVNASPIFRHGGLCRPLVRLALSLTDSQTFFFIRFSRKHLCATLRLFRLFRGQLAAARQLSGTPGCVIAHRTSPTNMGLALLANLSAFDFGYIHQDSSSRTHSSCVSIRWNRLETPPEAISTNWYERISETAAAPVHFDGR